MRSIRPFGLLALLPALAGVAALAAPAPTPPPITLVPTGGLTPLHSAQLPFTLKVPRDWAGVDLKDGMGGVSLQSSSRTPYSLMRLLYLPRQGAVNVASEFAAFEAALRRSGSLVLGKQQKASYGGVRGEWRTYTLSGKPGTLNMQVWFGVGARNVYTFMLSSPPQRFAADQATFAQVLSTVQF